MKSMETTITIKIPKKEKERLHRLALSYGLSLSDFSRHIFSEISSAFPEESLEDYVNPKVLKSSIARSVVDYKKGNVSHTL